MKHTKKILTLACLCALVLIAFTACHSHTALDGWNIDKDNHWRECECGEILETEAHTFEDNVCTLCEAQATVTDGVMTDIVLWNEYGDWTICLYYDDEGVLESDMRAEYTYDEDGNKLTEKQYVDGTVSTEGEYAFDSDGYSYLKTETEYYEDGSKCVYEYNEYGDSLGYSTYDDEGNPEDSYFSEYITDEDGNLVGEKVYENDALSQEIKYVNVITEEEEYAYAQEITYYSEDGSKIIEEYSEDGDVIREASYDADGKPEYDYTCENIYDEEGNLSAVEKSENGAVVQKIAYEYDSDGNQTGEKTYEGDKLIEETEYKEIDGYIYEAKKTVYNEDGTKTVYEFDENGEVVSETDC